MKKLIEKLEDLPNEIISFAERVSTNLKCNVYLVGSTLTSSTPRDTDIRAILSVPDFENLFGSINRYTYEAQTGEWTKKCKWKWAKKCRLFLNSKSALKIKTLDFQICYEGEYNEPKFLLAKYTQ